jgi:hypothetical protein
MLQRQFWNILFFGLLSSFVIYNVHYGGGRVHAVLGGSSSGSSIARLSLMPGKQHLLISSGAGRLAVPLALALLEEGHAVTLLDNASSNSSASKLYLSLQRSSSSFEGRVQVAPCDMQNAQQLAEVLTAALPDAVLLLAGGAAGEHCRERTCSCKHQLTTCM